MVHGELVQIFNRGKSCWNDKSGRVGWGLVQHEIMCGDRSSTNAQWVKEGESVGFGDLLIRGRVVGDIK